MELVKCLLTSFYGLSFYRLFTAFVPTFTDFYRLLSSLQTFIEFFDFKYSFLLLFVFNTIY